MSREVLIINSLGPHTARWAKAWDFQSQVYFPGDAGSTTLLVQMPLSRTRIVTKTGYFA